MVVVEGRGMMVMERRKEKRWEDKWEGMEYFFCGKVGN
jgi:hypothetical protein